MLKGAEGREERDERIGNRAPVVAVVVRRLGPYHHARLNAAGAQLSIMAIESCAVDCTYGWEKIAGAKRFSRVTLTECEQTGLDWRQMLMRGLWEKLSDLKPDVVAVPGWSAPEALVALEWCVMNRRPALLMSESARHDEIRRRWKERIKRRVVRLCSAALVGGRLHAEYLVELGMPRERIFLGYDAVDNDHFANDRKLTATGESEPRSAGFSLQQRKDFPPGPFPGPGPEDLDNRCRLKPALRPYFLASARFVEKKNLPGLIEAYARYRTGRRGVREEGREETTNKEETVQERAPWNLVLLGDGKMRPALAAQVATLNLQDHVSMPGFKQYTELPVYYASAGAFIHASSTEQWGLVVNEAMASGLPVLVSSRCGCAPELVKEGINGFTFDPFNIEQLAELMRRMAEMGSARRAEMGTRSREIISHWGTNRFAIGLQQATASAVGVARPSGTLVDRFLLRSLAVR